MMATGRKPLATAVKERSGSLAHDPQRRNENEPIPTMGKPEIPFIVQANDLALSKWNHLCDVLEDLGLLATSDSDLMAIYSVTWASWIEAQKAVWVDGLEIEGQKGSRTNPAVYEKNKAMDRLHKLGAEFGLSPSSRTRLSAAPKEESDPFLEYLKSNQGAN